MPTVIRSSLEDILPPILVRVRTVTGLPAERVFLCQREECPYDSQADSYVFLRVEDSDYDDPNVIGAGRTDTRETVVLTATVRSRLALDEADRDTAWMTHASLGHLRLRRLVQDALLLFQPEDGDGNWLVTEPIKPHNTRKPRKDRKPNPEWGESIAAWLVTFELAVDQTYQ